MENKESNSNVKSIVFLWLLGGAVVGLLEAVITAASSREEVSTAARFFQFAGLGLALYALVFLVISAVLLAATICLRRTGLAARRLRPDRSDYMAAFLFVIGSLYCFALAQHVLQGKEELTYVAALGGGLLFALPARRYIRRLKDPKKCLLLYITLCATITFFLRTAEILNSLLPGKFWQPINVAANIGAVVLSAVLGLILYTSFCSLLLKKAPEGAAVWRFKIKHALIVSLAATLGGASALVFLSSKAEDHRNDGVSGNGAKSRPNVLFITCDALRPDHLGCYGYQRNTSPNIDRLANNGVIFLQTITQCVSTKASLASMLTGLSVATHGVRSHYDRMPDSIYTLAEIMQDNGYTTACFTGTPWLARGFNYDQGFGYFQDFDSLKLPVTKLCLVKYLRGLHLLDFAIPKKTKVRASDIYEDLSRWRDKKLRQPFFIYIHFEEPHPPYNPPPPYDAMFVEGDVFDADVFKIMNETEFANEFIETLDGASPERKKKMRADLTGRYDGMIAYVDSYIGKILDDLRRLKAYDNTLVIISADHGQEFLEHGGLVHGAILYDESARIPLIVHYPSALPRGTRVEGQVRSIDVAPTILDLCDVAQSGGEERIEMDGLSLLPLIAGSDEAKKKFAQLPAFTESTLSGSMASIRFSGFKYILYPGRKKTEERYAREELYDLKNDPAELRNLIGAPDNPKLNDKQIATLKETLKQYMGRKPKYFDEHKAHVSKNALDRLKGYGYLK